MTNDELSFTFTEGDVQAVARNLYLLAVSPDGSKIIDLSDYGIESVSLDELASEAWGWTDPLGQAMRFLYEQLTPWFNWVVSQVTSWIQQSSLWTWVEQLYNRLIHLPDAVSQVLSGLNQIVGWIESFGRLAIDTLANAITQAQNLLSSAIPMFQQLVESVKDFIAKAPQAVQQIIDMIAGIPSMIVNVINEARATLEGALKWIGGAIESARKAIEQLPGMIESAVRSALNLISQIPSMIEKAVGEAQRIAQQVAQAVQGALRAVAEVPRIIQDALGTAQRIIAEGIDRIRQGIEQVVRLIAGVPEAVQKAVAALSQVPEMARKAWEDFAEKISKIAEGLAMFFQPVFAVPGAIEFLRERHPDLYREWREELDKYKTPLDWIMHFPEVFIKSIKTVAALMWDMLPKEIREALAKVGELPKALDQVGKAVTGLGAAFTGFINAVGNIYSWLKGIEEAFKSFLESVPKALSGMVDAISKAAKVFEPAVAFLTAAPQKLQELASSIQAGLATVANIIIAGAKELINAILGALRGVAEFVMNLMGGFVDWMLARRSPSLVDLAKKFVEPIVNAVSSFIIKPILDAVAAPVVKYVSGVREIKIEEVAKKITMTPPAILLESIVGVWGISYILRLVSSVFYSISDLVRELEARLEPLGLGTVIKVRPSIMLKEFAGMIWKEPKIILRAYSYGLGIWVTQPLSRAIASTLRNVLPMELPTLSQMEEIVRRTMPTPEFDKFKTEMSIIMALYGYSDDVISWFLRRAEDWHVTIKDRFGRPRMWPIAMIYNLPSPSDVCRMMVRDIIIEPAEFTKAMKMRGFVPDLAYMYYLLHFRYPSPERLWEFVCRAAADFLWFKPPEDEVESARSEAKAIGAFEPKAPVDLNVSVTRSLKPHFSALAKYMKWHDYARFSWIEGWTSDNWLVINMLADLPGRIDARWMYKWLILQRFGEIQFTQQPPREVVAVEDITNISRIVISRGMHPLWVPYISIAEAMNALSEERTLARTGFMNAFREGAHRLEDIEELMKGFFHVGYKVKVWDSENMTYVDRYVKVPVAFLPGERAFIELRALYDRAVDFIRDLSRTLAFAVRELIYKPEEAVEKLKGFIDVLNSAFFVEGVRKITGRVVRLSLDGGFAEALVKLGEILQDVYVVQRARYYLRYLMYRVMYRFSQGFISEEEAEKFFRDVMELCRESPLIIDLFKKTADLMMTEFIRRIKSRAVLRKYARGIIKYDKAINELTALGLPKDVAEAMLEAEVRAYIPTVSQVATLCEVVPEARALLPEVFEVRGVPEHHRQYWEKYVERRPLLDEVRRLVTALITAYAEAAIGMDELRRKLESLRAYGYTPEEARKIIEIAEIRRLIEQAREARREYIPTPAQLATIAEYVPEAVKLLPEVFKARHVPEKWRPIWEKYVTARPLANEVRGIMTAYRRCLVYGVVPKEIEDKVMKYAKLVGYTDLELEAIQLRAILEELAMELREARREYIPTPAQLASMAEYINVTDAMIQQVFEARHVPEAWRPIWKQYIEARPLRDEIARYLTTTRRMYEVAAIPLAEAKRILESMKLYGVSDKEIEVMIKDFIGRKTIRAYTMALPSIARLSGMYTYVPEAINLLTGRLKEMLADVPMSQALRDTIIQLWERYTINRSVRPFVRGYITELITAYAEGVIDDVQLSRELDSLRAYGLNGKQIEMIIRRAKLRRARYQALGRGLWRT